MHTPQPDWRISFCENHTTIYYSLSPHPEYERAFIVLEDWKQPFRTFVVYDISNNWTSVELHTEPVQQYDHLSIDDVIHHLNNGTLHTIFDAP